MIIIIDPYDMQKACPENEPLVLIVVRTSPGEARWADAGREFSPVPLVFKPTLTFEIDGTAKSALRPMELRVSYFKPFNSQGE